MNKLTKILLWVIAGFVLLAASVGYSYFSAEFLDEGSFLTTETIQPDNAVRIATMGDDLRLYTYTPPTTPYLQCFFVAGTNKGDNTCVVKQEYMLRSECGK